MYKIIIIINLKTSFNMKVDFSLQNDLESTNIVNVHRSNKLSSFRHQLKKSSLFIKRTNNIFQTNVFFAHTKEKSTFYRVPILRSSACIKKISIFQKFTTRMNIKSTVKKLWREKNWKKTLFWHFVFNE